MKIDVLALGMFQANCYIVSEGDKCFIVDPGERADEIGEFLQDNGLTPEFILLTHGHIDHVGAVDGLMDQYMIDAYISETDREYIDRNTRIFGKIFHPTESVSEGDEIDFNGKKIKVIETPGHTAGGVCFLYEDSLFSGDTLFRGSVGRTDLDGGSADALIDSITEKLMRLPEETKVYPGHQIPTTIGHEKKYNPFLRDYR